MQEVHLNYGDDYEEGRREELLEQDPGILVVLFQADVALAKAKEQRG